MSKKVMNPVKAAIKAYLDGRAEKDELFATAYANPSKNIDECFDYIVGEARKKGGNAVYVPDEVVFGWAVHYYDEKNIKVEKLPKNMEVSANASVELSEEDKDKAREMAVQEYKQQCIDKLKAADELRAKKEAEKKKAKSESRKKANQSMGNLFFEFGQ